MLSAISLTQKSYTRLYCRHQSLMLRCYNAVTLYANNKENNTNNNKSTIRMMNINNNNNNMKSFYSSQSQLFEQIGMTRLDEFNGFPSSIPYQRHNSSTVRRRRRSSRYQQRRAPPLQSVTEPYLNSREDADKVPVYAAHIAQNINLFDLISKSDFAKTSKKQLFGKNFVVVQFSEPDINNINIDNNVTERQQQKQSYAAIFRFGSVVLFNVDSKDVHTVKTEIKKYSTEPVLDGFERKEDFIVWVAPNIISSSNYNNNNNNMNMNNTNHTFLDYDSMSFVQQTQNTPPPLVTGDYCIVPELDMNGVAVISNIMAQTVALDSYGDIVDELLTNFATINTTVKKTGSFTKTNKQFLFKTVAQNNSIFIDMISKIRIKDRSDTAWKLTKYESIHYGLKDEFEIDDRFDNIEFKLNLIQKNAKFFLDVLHHQNSNSLEWIIVVLILAECVLMCIEMSGMGEAFFHTITNTILPTGVTNTLLSTIIPSTLLQILPETTTHEEENNDSDKTQNNNKPTSES